ncbi:GAF domain-containing protein [Deinococcus arcticus]|uniref:GAF domain-containing protein n=1 Tax=Deinococcus arcticus TaxID=2136176 RepID=UPI001304D043|nr:GAF domain-containing protein [Deinococcus arcticus]
MFSPSAASPEATSVLSERLQAVTEALAAAQTQSEVFAVVLTPALQALDARAGAVLLVDEDGTQLRVAARHGYDEGAHTLWQDGPLDGNVPAGDALARREALFFEQEGELLRAHPELEARMGGQAAVATAVLPMFLDQRPLGTVILDFKEPHHFTPAEQRFLRILAAQCAIALGRAGLMTDLQRQVEVRAARAVTEARAQEAFVAFTEAVGTQTHVPTLAQQAIEVLRARFPHSNVSYYAYIPAAGRWQAQNWSDNHSAAQQAMITAGFPADTPIFEEVLRTRQPVFRDAWNPQQEGIDHTQEFGTGATVPLLVNGEVRGIVGMADRHQQRWTEPDRALVRAVARGLTLALERAEQARRLETQNAELEARTLALERFAELARSQESRPEVLIRRAQTAVTELLGEGFAVYYELDGPVWRLRSQVGSPEDVTIQHSLDSALPYDTVQNFRIPWESGAPFYQDAYDPALDHGVPGVEALASTAALPVRVGGQLRGMFGYSLKVQRPWTRADRATLDTAVSSLGLSLERAGRSRALEEERASLDAFVAFSEAVGAETDTVRLAARAVDVLRTRFADCSGGYYGCEGDRWTLQTWTADLDERPIFLAALRAGLPSDTPFIAELLRTHAPMFIERWDAADERVKHSEVYGTVAAYPVVAGGQMRGFFTIGLKTTAQWTDRDRAIFRSVGRGLDLAVERAEQASRQARQAAELDARSRALEGFADLTRDLSVEGDPYVLIQRAQAVVLSLLPEGYALYFEPQGDRWVLHSQTGDLRSPALQAAADAGLPFEEANNLLIPYRSGAPYYQDQYARDTDHLDELVAHLGASATLPVMVNGQPRGVFAVVLFGGVRRWTRPDQAALESVVRSLGLALERAEGVALLAERTRELERSNAELEQFAYIASHDLQAPIRSVASFAALIDQRYGEGLDERGRLYLRQIVESGEHMKRLVDDLLAFSRVHTERRPLSPVDAAAVFDRVAGRLQGEGPGAAVTRGPLPVVMVDAQQLDQLFQNLLGNGLKYARPGVPPCIQVTAEPDGPNWRFAVQDNGIGIEPQYFERIFVIFQRLHGRERYEGTGIGLAVCKKIVERHGGRLWLDSTPGAGSTFFFTLPAA